MNFPYMDEDSFFANPKLLADDELHIQCSSPCVDAGELIHPVNNEIDIDGEVRIAHGGVDLGADEIVTDQTPFIRGDADQDGIITTGDLILLQCVLYSTCTTDCEDALDWDDDDKLTLADYVLCQDFLYSSGPPPPPPYPNCGPDPFCNEFICEDHDYCP